MHATSPLFPLPPAYTLPASSSSLFSLRFLQPTSLCNFILYSRMLHRLHSSILHLIQFNIVYPSLRLSEPRGPQPPAAEARYAFLRRLLPTHHRSSPTSFPAPASSSPRHNTILHCSINNIILHRPSLRLSKPRGPQPPAAQARYTSLRRLQPAHHRNSPASFPTSSSLRHNAILYCS